jgi:hypothetical protein
VEREAKSNTNNEICEKTVGKERMKEFSSFIISFNFDLSYIINMRGINGNSDLKWKKQYEGISL